MILMFLRQQIFVHNIIYSAAERCFTAHAILLQTLKQTTHVNRTNRTEHVIEANMMLDEEESMSVHENDLPLMSNVSDILVHHYILNLKCHLEDRKISGSVVICCKPTESDKSPSCDHPNADRKERLTCQTKTSNVTNSQGQLETASRSLTDSKVPAQSYIHSCDEKQDSLSTNTVTSPLPAPFVSDTDDCFLNKNLVVTSKECADEDLSDFQIFQNSVGSQNSVKEKVVFDRKRKSDPSDRFEDGMLTKKVHAKGETLHPDHIIVDRYLSYRSKSTDFNEKPCNEALLLKQNGSPSRNIYPEVSSGEIVGTEFQMILDCCDINILNVQDLTECEEDLEQITDDPINKIQRLGNDGNVNTNLLKFTVEKHCIRIHKPGCSNIKDFPRMLKISFLTKPEGQSLKWTGDQEGKPCVYTHGNWINNRSLFPSQDVPVSMATWQAVVSVEESVTVVMSGDREPVPSTTKDGWTHFYFHTQMAMPSSTISLAIGHWQVTSLINCDSNHSELVVKKTIPCRLFCAESLMPAARTEIGQYIGSCLRAAYDTLGPHPFQRLDIVIVPSSFDSLGMASPSMLYLSQSVLVGDFSMCVRIAHEVSHSWFGLAIGPSDWTEEWLTEGFCTYTEDIIHNLAMQTVGGWTEEYGDHHREIRDLLRYRTLVAELEHTDEELQTLRPNKEGNQEESSIVYVKNGMNPDKSFMQVHYVKGYFLLRYLERKAGRNPFLCVMKKYVQQFNGRLVSSQDVLSFFLKSCTELQEQDITEAVICSEWLDWPGIPKHLQNFQLHKENSLASRVHDEVETLADLSRHWKGSRKQWQQKRKCLLKMDAIQITLLMEELLHARKLSKDIIHDLGTLHSITRQNAEIQHRWCELVIQHKLRKYYGDIRHFLVRHQAMGVYLYGELMISRDKEQKLLAMEVFEQLNTDMEPDPLKSVRAMLYG
ncbi:aminopeptidase O-like isoform X2 [Mizuhopecten yessoensis]|uniref:aminopeptidase O-like isoform X2 n=1 Tax=Mizuhopecten yessoensis TaxID=6573 RepID=UPI000B45E4F4|nr:aminopeptidase O-like isoform X2 [Mizuhopecten yessoensis]